MVDELVRVLVAAAAAATLSWPAELDAIVSPDVGVDDDDE